LHARKNESGTSEEADVLNKTIKILIIVILSGFVLIVAGTALSGLYWFHK